MIDEEQAKVVRQVFNLYLKGYSVDGIIKYLATKNIKTPTGKDKWAKRAIQTMLCNEKYIGNVLIGKTYTTGFPNNKQKTNRGQQEQFIMEEAHEPIISRELFNEVQEEIKRRSNIEVVDGKAKRKSTHYSSKDIEENISDKKLAIGNVFIPKLESKLCYGFKENKQGDILINPIEAEVVKGIFNMHLFGRSIKRICENLSLFKEPGFYVPYKVKRKLVKEILRNERYAGYKFITDGNKFIEKRTN